MLFDSDVRKIVTAVIIQALRDAQKGSAEAKDWLFDEGVEWAEVFGFDLGDRIPEGRVSLASILDFE